MGGALVCDLFLVPAASAFSLQEERDNKLTDTTISEQGTPVKQVSKYGRAIKVVFINSFYVNNCPKVNKYKEI
jgi:hypothetical protein